ALAVLGVVALAADPDSLLRRRGGACAVPRAGSPASRGRSLGGPCPADASAVPRAAPQRTPVPRRRPAHAGGLLRRRDADVRTRGRISVRALHRPRGVVRTHRSARGVEGDGRGTVGVLTSLRES